ncbi:MAG: glutamine-hydrolyzing GMP synthase, partial [Smithella sp.]|nr:glutamine-hydrolyzing GMP synthase [Smithella sp.]
MILIIDFGSQYNQLIARRVRENHVYCQIEPPGISIDTIKELKPEGIILSGGPASIYSQGAPRVDKKIFDLGIPVLGICYGLQYMVDSLGGKVIGSKKREYGFAELLVKKQKGILKGVTKKTRCWMSHGDSIGALPAGFVITAYTANTPVAAAEDVQRNFYGLQFHPEVVHTKEGKKILANFLFDICRCKNSWSMKSFVTNAVEEIRRQVGTEKVILGLSGGVDSSVAAVLLHRAIGKQ